MFFSHKIAYLYDETGKFGYKHVSRTLKKKKLSCTGVYNLLIDFSQGLCEQKKMRKGSVANYQYITAQTNIPSKIISFTAFITVKYFFSDSIPFGI
jgi:hypothetical protein